MTYYVNYDIICAQFTNKSLFNYDRRKLYENIKGCQRLRKKIATLNFWNDVILPLLFVFTAFASSVTVTIVMLLSLFAPLKFKGDKEVEHLKSIAISVYEQKLNGATLIYVPDGYLFSLDENGIYTSSTNYNGSVMLKIKSPEFLQDDSKMTIDNFSFVIDDGLGNMLVPSIVFGILSAVIPFIVFWVISEALEKRIRILQGRLNISLSSNG